MKKLNIFLIALLILGQTILGPIGSVSADGLDEPPGVSVASGENDGTSDTGTGDTGTGDTGTGDTGTGDTGTGDTGTGDTGTGDTGTGDTETGDTGTGDTGTGDTGTGDTGTGDTGTGDTGTGDTGTGDTGTGETGTGNTGDDKSDTEGGPGPLGGLDFDEEEGTPPQVYDPTMNFDDVIAKTLLLVNEVEVTGNSIEVRHGDSVSLEYTFLDIEADDHNYGPGTTLTIPLPELFADIELNTTGSFYELSKSSDGESVIFTFNEKFDDGFGKGPMIENLKFGISATFDADGANWTGTIKIPGRDEITLNFKPKGGSVVSKTGTPENPNHNNIGQSSKYIDWSVDVNTNLANTTDPAVFMDTLSGDSHVFASNTVMIQELEVSLTGGEPVPKVDTLQSITSILTTTEDGQPKMSFNLPDPNKAYRITYSTNIVDPTDVTTISTSHTNTATYNGSSVPATVNVSYGDWLTKKGSVDSVSLETTWTIRYNFNRRNILAINAELTDVLTVPVDSGGSGGGSHEYVENSFAVYKWNGTAEVLVTPTAADGYDITRIPANSPNFTLKFKQDVTEPYIIRYKTKPDRLYPTTDMKVTNTVTRKDVPGTSVPDTVTYSKTASVLNKTGDITDYDNKRITWTITANQAGYILPIGTVINDTFDSGYLTLINDETFTVTVDGAKFTNYELAVKEGEVDGETGFTVTLKEEVSGKIVITYETDYEIKDVGDNDRTYLNSVKLTDTNLFPEDPEASDKVEGNPDQTGNGYKTGKYDYATKVFSWEVGFNYNLNTLTDAVFEDELPPTQKVGEVYIQKHKINTAGNWVPNGERISIENEATEPNKILLTLGDRIGKDPYVVTYTSVDADGTFPIGDVKIKNTAILKDGGTSKGTWSAEVTVRHTNKLIEKFGEQEQDELLNWNFKFNYAQSKLDRVVFTDTVGRVGDNPTQLIVENSFKVYEVALTGESDPNNVANIDEKARLLDKTEYHLHVDIKAGTFTLDLGNVTKAYYIEYDTIYLGASPSKPENKVEVTFESEVVDDGEVSFTILDYSATDDGSLGTEAFKVIKTGEEGKLLEGVEFTLFRKKAPTSPLISGETDEKGILDFGIKLSEVDYILRETSGYIDLDTGIAYATHADVEFKLHRSNLETEGDHIGYQLVNIQNKKLIQAVKLTKLGEGDVKLPGAVFTLHRADGTKVKEDKDGTPITEAQLTTDSNGVIEVNNLPPGDYYFIETEAPDHYVLDVNEENRKTEIFKIEANQTMFTEVDFTNERGTGTITINKVDATDGESLPGAVFALYNNGTSDQTPFRTLTMDTGVVTFDNLPYDIYTLKEVTPPDGYAVGMIFEGNKVDVIVIILDS